MNTEICYCYCNLWGGGSLLGVEGLYDWGQVGLASFQLYSGICLTTEEKHEHPQSGLPASVDASHCVDLAAFLGSASTGLLNIGHP
jgi:hypothetical protein